MRFPVSLTCALVASASLALTVASASADQAAIAEALRLGDPSVLSKLEPIYENKDPRQSESDNQDRASRVRSLMAAAIGDDRLLVEIVFDHMPVKERSSFCLYLDLDNDPQTGRPDEGAKGVDLMAAFETYQDREGYLRFCNPAQSADNTAMRYVWDENRLYITVQTPLAANGTMRAYFLSQKDVNASNFRTPDTAVLTVTLDGSKLPSLL